MNIFQQIHDAVQAAGVTTEPVLREHPAKALNGTPMLLAMQGRGAPIYAGTARPKRVAADRRRRAARRRTLQAQRHRG